MVDYQLPAKYIKTLKDLVLVRNSSRVLRPSQTIFLYTLILVHIFINLTACGGGSSIKIDSIVTWPQGLTAEYGQTLADIPLDSYNNNGGTAGTFSWTRPDDFVSGLGTQSYSMTFTPTEVDKYYTVLNDVNVLVVTALVYIPAGTFWMGSPVNGENIEYDEIPWWSVKLGGFYMGRYEVTQEEYESVMGNLLTTNNYGKGPNYPVYYVSWYDALVFCNKLSMFESLTPAYRINGKTNPDEWGMVPINNNSLWNAVVIVDDSNGYRLPTEAQWEYACRAGTTTPWHCGETSDNLGNYAWMSGNSDGMSHEVGKKQPNAWGLYDMYGNVSEWCWDWYGPYPAPAEAQPDPMGASSGSYRVLRGGCWITPAQSVRSADRALSSPDSRSDMGLRLVRPDQP